jgi:serine/threonine protein kinase
VSWNRLQEAVRRFEQEWSQGKRPAIANYLSQEGAERRALLIELVHTELELRLKAREPVRAEDYLAAYPELAGDPFLAEQLIATEAECREAFLDGSDPDTSTKLNADLQQEFAPIRLGRYELVEIVGEGSFGVVYRATDTELGRFVAVKVPRPGRLATPQDADRFLREARVTAKLSHPGIVQVHDAGRIGDRLFLVCEFVAGTTLAQRLAAGPLPPRAAAGLIARVAGALDHAHRQGIIHRDLKPSNILLDHSGEPRLTDFGLAKQEFDDVSLTLDGQMLGTPAYMSPEQASGEARHVDDRSDVYSLGVVLYQTITGELPFRGSPRMILRQILEEDPRPPSSLNHLIPRDLETICLKAMAKLPRDRYSSAAALANDLELFGRGDPIQARPLGPVRRVWRRARRQPLPFAFAAALIVAVMCGSIGVTWQWLQTRSALARERRQSERAIAALRHANRIISTLSRAYGERNAWRMHDKELKPFLNSQSKNVIDLYNTYRDLCRDEAFAVKDEVIAELALAQFNQGVMLRASGRDQEAEAAFVQALELGEEQLRRAPGELAARFLLADTRRHLAQIQRLQGRWHEAVRQFEQRVALLEQLALESSSTEGLEQALALTLLDLGWALVDAGRPADALDKLRCALPVIEDEARGDPPSLVLRTALCNAHCKIGQALDRLDRPAEAIESFQRALAISEELARDDPANVAYRQRLGMCHHVLGNLYDDLGRPAQASDCFRRALTIREALVRDYPKEPAYRNDLRGTRTNLQEQLDLLGQRGSPTASGEHSPGDSP